MDGRWERESQATKSETMKVCVCVWGGGGGGERNGV